VGELRFLGEPRRLNELSFCAELNCRFLGLHARIIQLSAGSVTIYLSVPLDRAIQIERAHAFRIDCRVSWKSRCRGEPFLRKGSMQAELFHALEDREQLRTRIAKLAGLSENSDVSAEQADVLKAEYEKRVQVVEQQIDLFRNKFRNEMSILKTTLDAYNAQIEKLREQAVSGAITPDQFQQQVGKAARGRDRTEEKLASFKIMLAAESPADLAGMTLPAAAGVQSDGGRDMSNLTLRIVGIVLGTLLVISTFMPAVPGPVGLARVSLFHVGTLIHNLDDSRGLVLWIGPITLGIVIGLTSLVSKRLLRGGILLFISILVLAPLLMSLAAATFYPMAISAGMTELMKAVASPGTGLFLMFAALLGTYILAGVNLWASRSGRGWSVLSVLLLAAAASGTSGYCLFGVNAVPQLAVAATDRSLDKTTVNVTVSNSGNLPMALSGELSDKSRRNEFVLKVQHRQADGAWSDVTTGLGEGLFDMEENIVAPGESKSVEYTARFEDGVQTGVIRAVLVNSRGNVVSSPPLELLRLSQPGPILMEEADRTVAIAEREVGLLEAQGGSILLDRLAESIAFARSAINRVQAKPERDELHKRVDTVILNAKDTQTRPMYTEASTLVENGLYDKAIETCDKIVGLCLQPPTPAVLEQDPQVLLQTRTLLAAIDMLVNPTKRYEVRGIITQGTSVSAMVFDNHTRQSLTVGVKDKLDDYTVDQIDDKLGTVMLRKGRDTFVLSRR